MSTSNSQEAPFQMHLEQDEEGRISRKIEYVAGRDPREQRYEYDQSGQLTAVYEGNGVVESYEYDGNGHRIAATWYEPEFEMQKLVYQEHYTGETRLCAINNRSVYHDDNGFRESWYSHSGEEHYEYVPDYRLLKITKEGPDNQPMTLEFDHDQNGQRCEKYVNGQLVELYDWHDLIRLASAKTHGQELDFHYRDGERTPTACTYNSEHLLYLYYDQVGSLRVVADEYGNVLKEVRYTAFGVIEEDTNPSLYIPIGFAGGLHDRDINWVRFGYRDYDPLTARFTAKDPLGYKAGDSDLRGYCFDDPVNGIDPFGLETRGLGVGFSGEMPGLAGGLSGMVSEDDDENRIIEISGEYGSGLVPGVNASATYQKTNARSVDQLSGESTKVGGGASVSTPYGNIGGTYEKIYGNEYEGENKSITWSRAPYKVPTPPTNAGIKKEHTWTFKVPKIKREYEPDLW